MDYKEKQRLARESTKPKLVDPANYTEHDKHVAAQFTVFNSRKARRHKEPSDPHKTKHYKKIKKQ